MGVLAINGGEKLRKTDFSAWPVFDDTERTLLNNVLESGKWWRFAFSEGLELKERTEGDDRAQVALFQEEFAAYQQAKYGIACANGTAALEIILKSLGIGAGDEVIVPSYTFVSTASSVLQVNAVPIFVDIDKETYNIDVTRIEETITPRTRAIIPVHFFGQPANMDAVTEIAKKHGLYVVEDACHGHGSEWRGKRVGALGDAGAFSFQASKNMTAGEGGIVLTNNKDVAKLCDSYIWLGREQGRPWYEFHRLGWNYRITEFQGAILRAQLQRLDSQIEKRDANTKHFYERIVNETEGLQPVRVLDQVTRHSWHIIALRFDPKVWGINKKKVLAALAAEGVPSVGDYWAPLYMNPLFLNGAYGKNGCPAECPRRDGKSIDYREFAKTNPNAEYACKEEAVWLEHRLFNGEQSDVDDIADAFIKVQRNIAELK